MTLSDTRWRAVKTRDASSRGSFVYGVRTTGIYCRPGCPSRRPSRGNVEFFETSEDAVVAGMRACKRCDPDAVSPNDARTAALERTRALLDVKPATSLDQLAAHAGLSPFHFHRVFRQAFGLTPAQYSKQVRLGKLRTELRSGASVTDAVYEAGFNSSARAYEHATPALGMTPGEYRKSGRGLVVEFAIEDCSLGRVLVAATARGLCSVALGDSDEPLTEDLRREFSAAEIRPASDSVRSIARDVAKTIDDPRRVNGVADPNGTAFQRKVWTALTMIPTGSTVSYSELARSIGQPTATRAVARACATNPIAVLVPCHRVVGANGALTGYRWGIERKRELLAREASKR